MKANAITIRRAEVLARAKGHWSDGYLSTQFGRADLHVYSIDFFNRNILCADFERKIKSYQSRREDLIASKGAISDKLVTSGIVGIIGASVGLYSHQRFESLKLDDPSVQKTAQERCTSMAGKIAPSCVQEQAQKVYTLEAHGLIVQTGVGFAFMAVCLWRAWYQARLLKHQERLIERNDTELAIANGNRDLLLKPTFHFPTID